MQTTEEKLASNSDNELTVSLKLDTRKAKLNGTYPVKLCIYYKPTRKAKYYGTTFYFTENEFESIWLAKKPREI